MSSKYTFTAVNNSACLIGILSSSSTISNATIGKVLSGVTIKGNNNTIGGGDDFTIEGANNTIKDCTRVKVRGSNTDLIRCKNVHVLGDNTTLHKCEDGTVLGSNTSLITCLRISATGSNITTQLQSIPLVGQDFNPRGPLSSTSSKNRVVQSTFEEFIFGPSPNRGSIINITTHHPSSPAVVLGNFFAGGIGHKTEAITYPPEPAPDAILAKEEDSTKACVVCLENARTCVMVPCGHIIACVPCIRQGQPKQCYTCKKDLTSVIVKFDA